MEYERTYGIPTDSYCVGVLLCSANGIPLIEFIFIDEWPTVEWLERLYRL